MHFNIGNVFSFPLIYILQYILTFEKYKKNMYFEMRDAHAVSEIPKKALVLSGDTLSLLQLHKHHETGTET